MATKTLNKCMVAMLFAVTSCQWWLDFAMNYSKPAYEFVTQSGILNELEKPATLIKMAKGFAEGDFPKDCLELMEKVAEEVSYPFNSTKSHTIKAIDLILQLDEAVDVADSNKIFDSCRDGLEKLRGTSIPVADIVGFIFSKMSGNKDAFTAEQSGEMTNIVFNYFMGDYEAVGKSLRKILTGVTVSDSL